MRTFKWLKYDRSATPLLRGYILKTKLGKILLVGDVNTVNGICDDCIYEGENYGDDDEVMYYSDIIRDRIEQILTRIK